MEALSFEASVRAFRSPHSAIFLSPNFSVILPRQSRSSPRAMIASTGFKSSVNTTPSVCSVYGYPGLELANRAGKALTHQAIVWRGPRHRVVVQPGARVKALARWTDIPGASSACGPTARKLKITLPGETRSLRLSWAGGVACSGRIDVRAFVPGAHA